MIGQRTVEVGIAAGHGASTSDPKQGLEMFDKAYEKSNFPIVRADWLARTAEAALEPELPIVDPHHHLWDVETCPYRVRDLAADVRAGHNVVATVYVEAKSHYRTDGPRELKPVGETEFAASEAAKLPSAGFSPCAGIVGYADLTLGERIAPVLERHVACGEGRFRGIRTRAAWHADARIGHPADGPPQGLLLQPAAGEAAEVVARMGLVLDVWAFHTQLSEVLAFASAHPGVRMVLNHAGGPLGIGPYAGRRDEVFEAWRRDMRRLRGCSNLLVKIGGFGMPRIGFGFENRESPPNSDELAAAIRPYVEECLDIFGPKRSMFESNFPVDKGAFSYGVMWNAFKKLSKLYSDEERADLFSRTASTFYKLDLSDV